MKWLPNAMNIDPSSERCVPVYMKMREHNVVLLSHAGEEKAVDSQRFQRLGNPLLLRRALECGVRVIIAHCASLGKNKDLDHPQQPVVSNFSLCLRMLREERWKGLLFADISAIMLRNREQYLRPLLEATDIHDRLVYGSDYPLPCIKLLVQLKSLHKRRLITGAQRDALKEVYEYNPLLFDFMLKRCFTGPNGERFPTSVFAMHPDLDIRPPQHQTIVARARQWQKFASSSLSTGTLNVKDVDALLSPDQDSLEDVLAAPLLDAYEPVDAEELPAVVSVPAAASVSISGAGSRTSAATTFTSLARGSVLTAESFLASRSIAPVPVHQRLISSEKNNP
mmetsp:Transcript_15537/g.46548  ORF Transcript_15537/g.46548 Transcript_15537/m.46548 type:complete len:338 (+) Transcript_15537:3-1016(+)